MKASIYRLRERGLVLPRPATPVMGELLLKREAMEGNPRVARLVSESRLEMLPALIKADVSVVSANGMVIHGIELLSRGGQKSRVHAVPQTWWVFVLTSEALDRYDGEDPLDALEPKGPCGF
ncbi:MAG: hypothetical protein IBJ14_05095 [Hydrogenophaga sp.]|nr:hypothetical protein [Hydrogenophaga sp.]